MSPDTGRAPLASAAGRKPSVLFVDDETRILDGLRRTLHPRRAAWHLRFAAGGPAALEALEREPADLVISDMRMPGMDGATLLAAVRERWPESVRIVLSGQNDTEAGLQSVRVVHQFLHKPCEPDAMAAVIERTVGIARRVPDPRLRAHAGSLVALAARPGSRVALERILADPQSTAAAAVPVIATDAALAAKILQLTGTSFFVRPHAFVDLETMVNGLGIESLRALGASRVFGSDVPGESGLGPWLEDHHARAVRAAHAGRVRCAEPTLGGVAYLRGLFSDLGSLVLASATGAPPADGGTREGDRSSAMLGAYLLGIWGAPASVVEAVASDAIGGQIDAGAGPAIEPGGLAA